MRVKFSSKKKLLAHFTAPAQFWPPASLFRDFERQVQRDFTAMFKKERASLLKKLRGGHAGYVRSELLVEHISIGHSGRPVKNETPYLFFMSNGNGTFHRAVKQFYFKLTSEQQAANNAFARRLMDYGFTPSLQNARNPESATSLIAKCLGFTLAKAKQLKVVDFENAIAAKSILALTNQEARRAALEKFGVERAMKHFGATVIDAEKLGNVARGLVELGTFGKFLVCNDGSTGRVYLLNALPEAQTAKEAVADMTGPMTHAYREDYADTLVRS